VVSRKWIVARTHIQTCAVSILAFADKRFFKNLEEVKK